MVRSFTDEPVAPDIVRRVVDTARRGPSAGYSQGDEFVVVTDPATRAASAAPGQETVDISGHHNFVAQAPRHSSGPARICCANCSAIPEDYIPVGIALLGHEEPTPAPSATWPRNRGAEPA